MCEFECPVITVVSSLDNPSVYVCLQVQYYVRCFLLIYFILALQGIFYKCGGTPSAECSHARVHCGLTKGRGGISSVL